MTRAPVTCLLLALVTGCNVTDPPLLQPLPLVPAGTAAATVRVNGTVVATDSSPPALYSAGQSVRIEAGGIATSTSAEPAGGALGGPADISLDFADTDIREVVAQVLGSVLRVTYTIDPAVRGTATLRSARPMTRAQALAALQAVLAQNGAALVQSGTLYRVVTQAAAAASPGLASGAGSTGASVVPLRYAAADELAKVLQPFVGAGGRIVPDPGRNALLITGDPTSRETLLGLVAAFDINLLAGQSYAVLPVANGDAKDFASALQEAVRGQGGGALAGVVRVIPMQRINAVLVVSAQPRYIEDVRRVYALVERGRRSSIRGWSVYYLQNSRSNDIAYVLQQAFTPRSVTAQPTAAGGVGPGRSSRSLGNSGGGGGGASGGNGIGISGGIGMRNGGGQSAQGQSGQGQSAQGQSAGTAGGLTVTQGAGGGGPDQSANPLLGGLEPSGGGGGGGDGGAETMRIIPNGQNNALLIYATPQERDAVESTLRRLDILPLQVRIDATIAEVTLNDQLRYGTQFYFTSGEFKSVLSTAAAISIS